MARAAWPRHIDERRVASHVFTVAELGAMADSDRQRAQRMLDGRTIAVTGQVALPRRPRNSAFSLHAGPEGGFRVHVGGVPAPREGQWVTVRGVARLERRSFLDLRGQAVSAVTPPGRQVSSQSDRTASRPNVAGAVSAPASTRFTPDAAMVRQAQQDVVRAVRPALRPGVDEAELSRLIGSGHLQGTLAKAMRHDGLDPHDLADVLAMYLLVSWQLANDTLQFNADQNAGIRQVRDGVRAALQARPELGVLDNAARQYLAEVHLLHAGISLSMHQHGRERQEPALLKSTSDDAQSTVKRAWGIDLRRTRLTARGFVPR
jgi:hypothetical protein